MKQLNNIFAVLLGSCLMMATGLVFDTLLNTEFVISKADARVGRPLTPGSVAGVARRTTRRHVRRTTVYVATLPRGCTSIRIDGMTLRQCGSTYYQPYGSQWVVVNVN